MILDSFLEFADAFPAFAGTGTARAPKVINLNSTGSDPSGGLPLHIVISINASFTGGGSSKVEFEVVSDAQNPVATDGSATPQVSTGPVEISRLVAGAQFILPIPFLPYPTERYLGLLIKTSGAATTAGVIDAFITQTPQRYKAYPEAVS